MRANCIRITFFYLIIQKLSKVMFDLQQLSLGFFMVFKTLQYLVNVMLCENYVVQHVIDIKVMNTMVLDCDN